MYVTGTLMPKYGGAAAFTTAAFFQELWLFCGIFKDYVDVISHNRAIQMLVVNASTDKLASSMMSGSVIMVMLYGIICGNYAQYGLMSAATSIPVVVGGMLVIRLVASRVVHTAFWSTAESWVCSICLSAGPVSALHLLWLTS